MAAYISRLPAVNHHNGVLIMEIIAQSVVALSGWTRSRPGGEGSKQGWAGQAEEGRDGTTRGGGLEWERVLLAATSGLTLNSSCCRRQHCHPPPPSTGDW